MGRYEKGNKLLRLPVRFVNGTWEYYFGGGVPVKEGTFAELHVHPIRISDAKFLERVTKPATVCVAKPGETLLVAVNTRTLCKSGRFPRSESHTEPSAVDVDHHDLPCENPTFVPVTLLPAEQDKGKPPPGPTSSGLWLKIAGTSDAELMSGPILLPEEFGESIELFPKPTAISLNHAFTILSEKLETHRISHTGNAYSRVYYRESNNRWYPLEHLRNRLFVSAERRVIKDAWAELEKQLGFSLDALPGGKRTDQFKNDSKPRKP